MDIIVREREIPEVGRTVYVLSAEPGGCGITVRLPERSEELRIPEICTDESAARELFELIVEGCVTPVTLRDVVYDWLCR